ETRNNVPSRTKIGAAFSFKPGTPKRMRDGELDAKRWIITEQKLWYSVWAPPNRYRTGYLDHQGHEVTQRLPAKGFLRVPSCPSWLNPDTVRHRRSVDAKPAVILYSRMKMSADFLTRLQKSAVLCDGAMGTLLYRKGIFINRCYDELNLSQPDLIRGVHREYLQAGAEIIETNTFGGN